MTNRTPYREKMPVLTQLCKLIPSHHEDTRAPALCAHLHDGEITLFDKASIPHTSPHHHPPFSDYGMSVSTNSNSVDYLDRIARQK